MGIDPAHIINHDMYFEHTDDFIKQIEQRTGLPVFTEKYFFDNASLDVNAHDDFKGWTTHTERGLDLQQFFETGEMLEFRKKGLTANEYYMYVNPYLLEITNDEFYMGRWSTVKYLADWIRNNGIPSPEYYEDKTEQALWVLRNRRNLFRHAQTFGTTKMITFCNDKHQDWLNYFFDNKWSMEQFIEWGKKEFIYVKFNELHTFTFPDENGYYDVFIEDDFEDLQ